MQLGSDPLSAHPVRPWRRKRYRGYFAGGIAAVVAAAATLIAVSAQTTPLGRIGPSILQYRGVNFAGAEFNPARNPGAPFKDYTFPKRETVAPFVAMGMNAARLPIRWERLQYSALGPLDRDELRRIDDAVRTLGAMDLIIIDLHNYARYRGVVLDAGSASALSDVWQKLATHFRNDQRIAFGLMNEPNGISATVWRDLAQSTILTIRATGARNLVLVPGTRWSGAHSWAKEPGSNAAAMASFRDPAGNFAFEMHQYLDGNSSGTSPRCVDAAKAGPRLTAATQWLRSIKARGFLGEFASGPDANCLAALDGLLDTVEAGSDVWLGWTYWAAGSWWGKYPMSVQPNGNGARPQAEALARHLGGTRS